LIRFAVRWVEAQSASS